MPVAELDHRILLARVAAISRQRPTIFVWNIVIMFACVVALWGVHRHQHLLGWWAANAALSSARLYDWWRLRARPPLEASVAQRWLNRVTAYSAIAGLIWGIGAWLFLSAADIGVLVFFLLTLIAVTNGGTIAYAAHYPATIAFATPITLLVAGRLVQLELEYANVLAASSLLFLLFTLAVGRNYAGILSAGFTLDVRNAELLVDARRSKETAERANEDKSRFLAAISHDLRQPLYAMGLLLESLGERLLVPEQKKLYGDIARIHRAMADMFGALLEISQLDAAVVRINARAVHLDPFITGLLREVAPIARRKNLHLSAEDCDIWVHTDPVLLARILRNLLSNAVKFTDMGGVTVACSDADGELSIFVTDTGPGIDPTAQQAVFGEYIQLGNPERDREQGLGLGLAVVNRLCKLLEIEVSLESSLGRGSVFGLRFLENTRTSASVSAPGRAATIARLHVIVIDDDIEVRRAIALILADRGCVVTASDSSSAAIDAMRAIERPPDIVVCDYRLPGPGNGLSAVAELRAAIDLQLPALIVTGDTDPSIRDAARAVGLQVLYKPVDGEAIARSIAELVGCR